MATFDMRQVAFKVARPDATLKFRVMEPAGFVATAKLDLDIDTVAKFRSEEIVGKLITEPLIPTGMYTLEIRATLIAKSATDLNVEVTVTSPGKQPEVQTMTFTAKKSGDICQALAFVLIK